MQTLLFADSSKAGSSRLPAQVYCLPVRPILAQLETDCSNPVIAAILWLLQPQRSAEPAWKIATILKSMLYVKALLTVTSWKQSLGNSKHFKLLDRIGKSEICWDTVVKSAIEQIWCAPWTSRILVNSLKEHSKRNLILDKASWKWISVRQKRQRTHSSLCVVK